MLAENLETWVVCWLIGENQEYVKINGIKDNIDTENVEKISEEETYKKLSESVKRWQKKYKQVATNKSFKNNDNNQKGDDDSENSF